METGPLLKVSFEGAHQIFEDTLKDVTPEQATWSPPGNANSIAVNYAHAIITEDMFVNGMLKGAPPIAATDFAGKAGVSEMPPAPDGSGWGDWADSVKVDLPQLREYAQAVYAGTSDYIGSLDAAGLDREIDLSSMELGKQTVSWVLNNILLWHINAHCGEISCLKGMQGTKGYPF